MFFLYTTLEIMHWIRSYPSKVNCLKNQTQKEAFPQRRTVLFLSGGTKLKVYSTVLKIGDFLNLKEVVLHMLD